MKIYYSRRLNGADGARFFVSCFFVFFKIDQVVFFIIISTWGR